jgi:multicomponent Na+:H+ antiporter subunit D
MWIASKPINAVNEFADNVWKNIGLRFTMLVATFFSWFDKEAIDWVIDGSAKSVVSGGDQLRQIETGKVQQYIGFAVALLFVVLIAVVIAV